MRELNLEEMELATGGVVVVGDDPIVIDTGSGPVIIQRDY